MGATDQLTILQGFVDSYVSDIDALRVVLEAGTLSEAAERPIIGALNYVLDMLDIFPDHYEGLGVADDAAILRIGAAQAVAAGAHDGAIEKLARQAGDVRSVFGELTDALERFVALLPDREVRGRTTQQIIASKDTRVMFLADVVRQAKSFRPTPVASSGATAEWTVSELKKMAKHALKKAGLLG
jgi:uncharacterized membrane protein YkvA (DUF1232 family)